MVRSTTSPCFLRGWASVPFRSFSPAPQPGYTKKPASSLLYHRCYLGPGAMSPSCQVNASHTRAKTGGPGFSSSFSKATNWLALFSVLPFKLGILVMHSDTHLSEGHLLVFSYTTPRILCLSELS